MSTDDPRRQGSVVPSPPPLSAYVEQVEADVEHLAQRARVPDWVRNPEKWQTLSRKQRRELIAHHRRQQR